MDITIIVVYRGKRRQEHLNYFVRKVFPWYLDCRLSKMSTLEIIFRFKSIFGTRGSLYLYFAPNDLESILEDYMYC